MKDRMRFSPLTSLPPTTYSSLLFSPVVSGPAHFTGGSLLPPGVPGYAYPSDLVRGTYTRESKIPLSALWLNDAGRPIPPMQLQWRRMRFNCAPGPLGVREEGIEIGGRRMGAFGSSKGEAAAVKVREVR